jgi:hypothetical protein
MNAIISRFRQFFAPQQPLPAGMHHFQAPTEAPSPYRLHLRLETSGEGTLIVNASTVLHLNQTAAEYAYHFIHETPAEQVIHQISRRYRVKETQAGEDYRLFKERLDTLIATPDLDPVSFLDFERTEPKSGSISAPYRLDCALTYRLANTTAAGVTPVERVVRELTQDEWQTILTKAWQAGIPHVVFTGGEPTLRPDLPDLVAFAEKTGFVTGLLTDGLRLAEKDYLHILLANGLDHLMLLLDPENETSWEALRDVLAEDIFTTVHLTLTPDSPPYVALINRLSQMGLRSLSLSAVSKDLGDALMAARNTTADQGISLAWDLPVPYSQFNPVSLEIETGSSRDDGLASLYIEPDGDLLPEQGHGHRMGNLLLDNWETVWKNRPSPTE